MSVFGIVKTLTNDVLHGLEVLGETVFPEPVVQNEQFSKTILTPDGKLDSRFIVIENGACVGCTAPGSTEIQACDYCGRGKDRR